MLRDVLLQITWGRSARFQALAVFFLLLSGCALPGSPGAQVKPVRRALILDDLGIVSSHGFAEVNQTVLAHLHNSTYQIELHEESLDVTLFPDEAYWFHEEFARKHSDRKPDVIAVAGSASLKFRAETRREFREARYGISTSCTG